MNPEVWTALGVSLRVATSATLLVALPGTAIALALARAQRGTVWRSLVETLVAFPLVLPPTAVGYLIVLGFARDGPLGSETIGADLGVLLSFRGAVLASSVMALPLFVRTARVAFEEVEPRLELMGRSLGMSRTQVFLRVTLPQARRGVLAAFVLGFGRALGEFGASAVVAGNVAGETRTLSMAIYDSYQVSDPSIVQYVGVAALLAFVLMFVAERLLARRAGSRARSSGGSA